MGFLLSIVLVILLFSLGGGYLTCYLLFGFGRY
jgi:hypothetical protein